MARFFTYCGDYVLNYNTGEQAGRSSRHRRQECCVLLYGVFCCDSVVPLLLHYLTTWPMAGAGTVRPQCLLSSSHLHFGKKTKHNLSCHNFRRGLFSLWLELFQLPSQLRSGFWAAVCTVLPHRECPLLYVRTEGEQSLKVRLKLEPFHHEALWEVLCVWKAINIVKHKPSALSIRPLVCYF